MFCISKLIHTCSICLEFFYNLGHTTVGMIQRLMANIDLFGVTRKAFHSRDAFNVHTTTKHSEEDSFPEKIKATNFILQRKFLKPDKGRKNVEKFNDPKKGLVSNSNINAYGAGKTKIQETFNRKLFSLKAILNVDGDEGDSD